MKQWLRKLLIQFDDDDSKKTRRDSDVTEKVDINEDRATLLYILDVYNKHLLEIEQYPVRKTREILDEFSKSLIKPGEQNAEKLLFRIRQFFNSYRINEYTYIQKTFDDFKNIIWDFADQLGDDVNFEQAKDNEVHKNLEVLREAVESNSIEELRNKSREFIDFYVEYQTEKEVHSVKKINTIQKNLDSIKKKLTQAHEKMQHDHLTGAYNRMAFDEQLKNHYRLFQLTKTPCSLITLDIDFFKKINDSFGHDVGDFVLKECVRLTKEVFGRTEDFVARTGGEEFCVILPSYQVEFAVKKAEEMLQKVRKDVIVHKNHQIKYTVSMGIAQLGAGESPEEWLKRADQALYSSKHSGRDRFTVAAPSGTQKVA